MENTLENKAKFFAQYWGQEVVPLMGDLAKVDGLFLNWAPKDESCFIQLKPLSSITDEDAKKLGYSSPLLLKKHSSFHVDELRGLGYALWWHGLSIEKQIEYGWIKLKSE